MRFILLLVYWPLAYRRPAFASPLSPGLSENNNPSSQALSVGLTASSPPDGGPDFSISVSPQSPLIPIQDHYRLLYCVCIMMAALALPDWTTPVEHLPLAIDFPRYPGLSVVFIGTEPFAQRLEHRVVLWGLASFMNYMVRRDQFVASRARLMLRGVEIGWIDISLDSMVQENGFDDRSVFNLSRFSIDEDEDDNDTNSTTAAAAATPSSTTNNDFPAFEFEFHGTVLDPLDILMGTIGSIVQAAEHAPSKIFAVFIGHWQQRFVANYRCFQIWMSISNPSSMSKKWLLQSMMQSVHRAMQQRDFRELKVLAQIHGIALWQGGYARTFGPELLRANNITDS
ncbi:MAG: hypothetical protein Q9186_002722 [Xanthomendoza sp. 1 TL-2023]